MAEKERQYIVINSENELKHFDNDIYEKTVVVSYFYYLENINDYVEYLNAIPESINLIIFSSRQEVLDALKEKCKHSQTEYRVKPNRGRDISTLLIECRELFEKYYYFCFIHDKSWKNGRYKDDTIHWRNNLWGNMLISSSYINGILNCFVSDDSVGVLIPPERIGDSFGYGSDNWGSNFDNTYELAKKLSLEVLPSRDIQPIALGTVFWSRTSALKKIFDISWKYEDFQDEPMEEDGTISHAVERVLPYLAETAGYKVVTVMNEHFAAQMYGVMYNALRKSFGILSGSYIGTTMQELDTFEKKYKGLLEYCRKHDRVYLYGAGKIGKECLRIMRLYYFEPMAFIVSELSDVASVYDVPIVSIKDVDTQNSDNGIIVSVGKSSAQEIVNKLNEKGINDYYLF